jgi:M6 family metalloprotease-like protein
MRAVPLGHDNSCEEVIEMQVRNWMRGVLPLLFSACGTSSESSRDMPAATDEQSEAIQFAVPRETPTPLRPVVNALTPRKLAVIFGVVPGPVSADESAQWTTNVGAGLNITGGGQHATRDVLVGGPCSALLGLELGINLNHRAHQRLQITVSNLDSSGATLASKMVWDGPTVSANMTPAQIANLRAPSAVDIFPLLKVSTCIRFRIDVVDVGPFAVSQGQLVGWNIKMRTGVFPPATNEQIRARIFGTGALSANSYLKEVSRGKTSFQEAALLRGTSTWRPGDSIIEAGIDAVRMLDEQNFPFASFDSNNDGLINPDELAVVLVDNLGQSGQNQSDVAFRSKTGKIITHIAAVGQDLVFPSLVHELLHTLGAVDIYGDNWGKGECFNTGFSIMGCTGGVLPTDGTVYLDAWHRLKFGWLNTQFVSGSAPSSIELGNESFRDASGNPSRPGLVFNPNNGFEYALLEYRDGQGFDRSIYDKGVLVWSVKEKNDGSPFDAYFVRALDPSGAGQNSYAWKIGNCPFQVGFRDGGRSPYAFRVAPSGRNDSVRINYEPIPASNRAPTIQTNSPAAGAQIEAGTLINLSASVSDPDNNLCGIEWSSDVDGPLNPNFGFQSWRAGPRNITVSGTDNFGARTSAVININLIAPTPRIEIGAPLAGQQFYKDDIIPISGKVITSTGPADCSVLHWSIDRVPGWSATGCTVSTKFTFSGSATLTASSPESNLPAKSVGFNISTTCKLLPNCCGQLVCQPLDKVCPVKCPN